MEGCGLFFFGSGRGFLVKVSGGNLRKRENGKTEKAGQKSRSGKSIAAGWWGTSCLRYWLELPQVMARARTIFQ